MLKAIKFFIALCLLPALLGLGRAAWRVVSESSASHWWGIEFFFPWMAAGAILGAGVLFFFPVPLRPYVAGHELTHALWAKLCGGRVSKIHIRSDSGYIISDCNNFMVTLSPYFFPFYAWLSWCVFVGAFLIWRDAWILRLGWVCIGMSLAFHFYFLGRVMFTRQSDFKSQGYFFSYVVILLGNGLLILAICLLQKPAHLAGKTLFWDFVSAYRDCGLWLFHWMGGGK